jgi:hypothetical protein
MAGDGEAQSTLREADSHVFAAVLVVFLVAIVLLIHVRGDFVPVSWPPHSLKLRCLAAAGIGGAVGFAELVSRYRDEPWRSAATWPGVFFIGLNAVAALLALLLMEHFRAELNAPADGVARVLIAGFGAMVILRSKLLTVRQADGTDIAVGPALALDSLLAAVNRDIDRGRAARRHRLVTGCAEEIARYDFDTAVNFLRPSILAFQSLDPAERSALNESLTVLRNDQEIRAQPVATRYKYFFFDLLTTCGERTFLSIYDDLKRHLARVQPTV